MPDLELTQDYLGGAKAGDCGHIHSNFEDGTVKFVITRRNCESIPELPIDFVKPEHLIPCHCDE